MDPGRRRVPASPEILRLLTTVVRKGHGGLLGMLLGIYTQDTVNGTSYLFRTNLRSRECRVPKKKLTLIPDVSP
jgi:hypothetical protein